MKLQVLCRGSMRDGLGHLLRTRTFARLAAQTHEVEVVAVVEPDLEPLLADLPCPLHPVRSDDEIPPFLDAFAPDVVVFDTVRLRPATFAAAAAAAVLLVSISPVFEHAARLDVLVTRSARNPALPGVHILGGLPYAIVNDRCQAIDDATYERNLALAELPVAICMGGADAANKTLGVLRALSALPQPLSLMVMLGEGYAHSYNALVEAVRGESRHEVILAKTNRSMWRLMSHCAVAILAGGITSVEALHAGLPTINLFEVPEHQAIMRELLESGVCLDGGLFSEASLATTVERLRHLDAHRDELRALRQRSRGLVDLHGPSRVLQAIEQHLLAKALRQARRAPAPSPATPPSLAPLAALAA